MNPPGMTPPPPIRRFTFTTLLMIVGLAVYFVWLFAVQRQQNYYNKIIQEGKAALSKKDLTQARASFDTFVRSSPTDPLTYLGITQVCLTFEQPTLAIEYIQHGLDACKDSPPAQRARLYVMLAESQTLAMPAHPQTQAIASARTALSLDPENPELQNALGYMLVDNDQNPEEAEKLVRQALQSLKPHGEDPFSDTLRPVVEDSFGWMLYKKGNYTAAVAALNQAVQDMPMGEADYTTKYLYYHLGAAYRKAGQIEEARRILAIALQYDPDFAEAKAEQALLPPPNTPAAQPPPAPTP